MVFEVAPVQVGRSSADWVHCPARPPTGQIRAMKYRLSFLGIVAASTLLTGLSRAQPAAPQPQGAAPAPGSAPAAAPAPEAPRGSVPVAPGGPPPASGANRYYEQAPPPQPPADISVASPPPSPA